MPVREWSRRVVAGAAVIAIVMTVACWPTSRYVGVNFVISEQRLPLWVKAVEFIDRDVNFGRTADAVLSGIQEGEAMAEAALAWTRANIRPAPGGLPIVDDHLWNVIVRGYGQADQQADVFTTLLAYRGVRAYWMFIGRQPAEIAVSYVWIRDRWRVYDVARGIVFRNASGDLATPEELAANHDLIKIAAAPAVEDVDNYLSHFDGYQAPVAPDVLRADLQMPARRARFEAQRLLRMQGREWQMRPPAVATRAEVRTP